MKKFEFTTAQELFDQHDAAMKIHSERLKFYDNGVEIDAHYFIEKDRIDSEVQLLKWMHQLMEKNWFDKDFALYFMEQVAYKYKLEIYGC